MKDTIKVCNAKSKRTQKPCKHPAAKGSDKCRFHGGKTPSGVDSPHFQTGKFSKVLKGLNLQTDYEEALNDPKLHYCRNEIALVDSLMIERLKKLAHGETEDAWIALQNHYIYLAEIKSYLEANPKPEKGKKPKFTKKDFDRVFAQIADIVYFGLIRYTAFEIVQPMLEQRRKLCETESKIIKENEHSYPAEKAFAFVVLVGSVVKKYIVEPEHQEAAAKELSAALVQSGD